MCLVVSTEAGNTKIRGLHLIHIGCPWKCLHTNPPLVSRHHINVIDTFDPAVDVRNYRLCIFILLCFYFVQNPLKTCKRLAQNPLVSKHRLCHLIFRICHSFSRISLHIGHHIRPNILDASLSVSHILLSLCDKYRYRVVCFL